MKMFSLLSVLVLIMTVPAVAAGSPLPRICTGGSPQCPCCIRPVKGIKFFAN